MLRLQNQITIYSSQYMLLIRVYDSRATFELITDQNSSNVFRIYEGSIDCKSSSGNKENIKRYFTRLLDIFQNKQRSQVNLKDMTVKYLHPSNKKQESQKFISVKLKQKYMSTIQLTKQLFIRQFKILRAIQKRNIQFAQNFQKIIQSKAQKILESKLSQLQQKMKNSLETTIVTIDDESTEEILGAPRKKVKVQKQKQQQRAQTKSNEVSSNKKAQASSSKTNSIETPQRSDLYAGLSASTSQNISDKKMQKQKNKSLYPNIININVMNHSIPFENHQQINQNKNIKINQINNEIDPKTRARKTVQQRLPIIEQQSEKYLHKKQQNIIKSTKEQNKSRNQDQQMLESNGKTIKIQQQYKKVGFIEDKWLATRQGLKNFLTCQNFVKYGGQNIWSRMALNYPLKNQDKISEFKIKIHESTFNSILIGVTGKKGIKTECRQHHLVFDKPLQNFNQSEFEQFKFLTARFKQNDIVKITIDWANNRIQWRVNDLKTPVIYQQIKNLKYQTLYPCIEMFKQGDMIQWID